MTKRPTRVRDLMSEEVVTLGCNEALSIADNVMQLGRIRHMPVIDEEGQLVGILSQRDLFRGALVKSLGYGTVAQNRMMGMFFVKEVMSSKVVTTTPDTALSEAAKVMSQRKLGCLPVVEDGKLVGILTEGDFVAHFARGEDDS